jgi:hypothetical protein
MPKSIVTGFVTAVPSVVSLVFSEAAEIEAPA